MGYWLALVLHLSAMGLWLGHMFAWALVVGPAMKRITPPETAELLRERSVWMGGFGWPALIVLVPTGLYLLRFRGIAPADLFSAETYAAAPELGIKLAGVLFMIGYQAVFGHRPAPRAIYVNMAVALLVLLCSVLLVRGWA